MKRSYGLSALPAMALAALLATGCGPSTTNEENITPIKVEAKEGARSYSNYAEYAKAQNEQAAKSKAAKKGTEAPKGKAAP